MYRMNIRERKKLFNIIKLEDKIKILKSLMRDDRDLDLDPLLFFQQ